MFLLVFDEFTVFFNVCVLFTHRTLTYIAQVGVFLRNFVSMVVGNFFHFKTWLDSKYCLTNTTSIHSVQAGSNSQLSP